RRQQRDANNGQEQVGRLLHLGPRRDATAVRRATVRLGGNGLHRPPRGYSLLIVPRGGSGDWATQELPWRDISCSRTGGPSGGGSHVLYTLPPSLPCTNCRRPASSYTSRSLPSVKGQRPMMRPHGRTSIRSLPLR